MADNDDQTVLIEQLVDQNTAILEYVGELPGIKKDMAELKEGVAGLKSAMQVVTAAMTDSSQQRDDHEHRSLALKRRSGAGTHKSCSGGVRGEHDEASQTVRQGGARLFRKLRVSHL